MNHDPDSPYQAPSAPVSPGPAAVDARGSRKTGFGLFWLVAVGGSIALMLLAGLLSSISLYSPILFSLLGLAPWAAALALAIGLVSKGKTRTAQGIAFGFLSLFAVGLLLVAACFGILALGGFGNWH